MLTDAEKEAEMQRQMALYHAELEAYVDSRVPASERSPSYTEQYNRLMRKSVHAESGGVAGQTLADGSSGGASQGFGPGSQSAGSARSAAGTSAVQLCVTGACCRRLFKRYLPVIVLHSWDRCSETLACVHLLQIICHGMSANVWFQVQHYLHSFICRFCLCLSTDGPH